MVTLTRDKVAKVAVYSVVRHPIAGAIAAVMHVAR